MTGVLILEIIVAMICPLIQFAEVADLIDQQFFIGLVSVILSVWKHRAFVFFGIARTHKRNHRWLEYIVGFYAPQNVDGV